MLNPAIHSRPFLDWDPQELVLGLELHLGFYDLIYSLRWPISAITSSFPITKMTEAANIDEILGSRRIDSCVTGH